jgi:hypothetical protein
MTQHVGVAISGGGHRATMWGLGTLLYLVDADKHREVAAISSVSGGSIANGVVAHEVDLPQTDIGTFDAKMAHLVRNVADTGLFFWARATNAYLALVFAVAAVGVGGLVWGIVELCLDGLTRRSGVILLAALLVIAFAVWLFEQRSVVVDRAMARVHFSRGGRPTLLTEVQRSVDHVICATELQSADHLYQSPRFLYSYRFGIGSPAQMRVSTAVQTSACLPGAFAVRRLPTKPYGFAGGVGPEPSPGYLWLVDGGVYDNMADQWLDGLARRLERLPSLPVVGRDVDEVVVVNASAASPWTKMKRARLAVVGELTTLMRSSSVMYQETTAPRRYALVDKWDRAQLSGKGQRGALVQISQSPYRIADIYRGSTQWPDRATRADAVIALLGDDGASRAAWEARTTKDATVPTVLRKLGRGTTVDLLEHSYVLAMCNLHVLLGYPLRPLPGRDRFERLFGA